MADVTKRGKSFAAPINLNPFTSNGPDPGATTCSKALSNRMPNVMATTMVMINLLCS